MKTKYDIGDDIKLRAKVNSIMVDKYNVFYGIDIQGSPAKDVHVHQDGVQGFAERILGPYIWRKSLYGEPGFYKCPKCESYWSKELVEECNFEYCPVCGHGPLRLPE